MREPVYSVRMSKSRASKPAHTDTSANLFAIETSSPAFSQDETPPRLYADMYYALWDVKQDAFLCDTATGVPYLFADYNRAKWIRSVRTIAPVKNRHASTPQYKIVVAQIRKQSKD